MRALEIGLTVLGAKFGVSLAHTNWAPAIEEIESKIRDMHRDPAWKNLSDCKQQVLGQFEFSTVSPSLQRGPKRA